MNTPLPRGQRVCCCGTSSPSPSTHILTTPSPLPTAHPRLIHNTHRLANKPPTNCNTPTPTASGLPRTGPQAAPRQTPGGRAPARDGRVPGAAGGAARAEGGIAGGGQLRPSPPPPPRAPTPASRLNHAKVPQLVLSRGPQAHPHPHPTSMRGGSHTQCGQLCVARGQAGQAVWLPPPTSGHHWCAAVPNHALWGVWLQHGVTRGGLERGGVSRTQLAPGRCSNRVRSMLGRRVVACAMHAGRPRIATFQGGGASCATTVRHEFGVFMCVHAAMLRHCRLRRLEARSAYVVREWDRMGGRMC